MGKYTKEFKLIIANEILEGKGYTQIEREYGILRGTAYTWVSRLKLGKELNDNRGKHNQKEYDEYEFLKKSFALLKKIRTK